MFFKTYLSGENAVDLKIGSQKNRERKIIKTRLPKDLPEDSQEGKQRVCKTVSWESCFLASKFGSET